jgi:hypothetical protein
MGSPAVMCQVCRVMHGHIGRLSVGAGFAAYIRMACCRSPPDPSLITLSLPQTDLRMYLHTSG